MVKALILYTDGKYKVKDLKDVEEYGEIVGGSIERLLTIRDYVHPQKKSARLTGFVNESGMIDQLPLNPFAGILALLGVDTYVGLFLYGNVILFSDNTKAIDPYIISLFDEYETCDDVEAFYCALEELNNKPATVVKEKVVPKIRLIKRYEKDVVGRVKPK